MLQTINSFCVESSFRQNNFVIRLSGQTALGKAANCPTMRNAASPVISNSYSHNMAPQDFVGRIKLTAERILEFQMPFYTGLIEPTAVLLQTQNNLSSLKNQSATLVKESTLVKKYSFCIPNFLTASALACMYLPELKHC